MKKEYNTPVVNQLGSTAEQTKGGSNTGSDSEPFRQNTGGLPPADIGPRSS
ncbi:MAG: hypothetical protein JJU31_08585 [Wenzhouxiangella sp.]|nr:hypothetical protein [Wenzhouxiangella sp.]MCH8476720.1 hypothetical protein [Wenzhouxiangella sp.]